MQYWQMSFPYSDVKWEHRSTLLWAEFDVLNCPIQKQNLIKTHKPVVMLLLLGTVPEGGGVVDPGERRTD